MSFSIRTMQPDDWQHVAELIFRGTNAWYEGNGRPPIFMGQHADALLFCEVYEDLDPGCCLLAIDDATQRIAGSCFVHERPTHVSLGIMNVHPDYFGQRVARLLLRKVLEDADARQKPVRLVSSAMNLDSYSLYNRAGFTPRAVFQDMILQVPETGLEAPWPATVQIRVARLADVPLMTALECKLTGIERSGDYEYFIRNERGIWRTLVAETESTELVGFLGSVTHPGSNMLGPGLAIDDDVARQLIVAQLDQKRGQQPVWLVPTNRPELVQSMYLLGAKNCELHFSQVRGDAKPISGVMLPTFMPETA